MKMRMGTAWLGFERSGARSMRLPGLPTSYGRGRPDAAMQRPLRGLDGMGRRSKTAPKKVFRKERLSEALAADAQPDIARTNG